MMNLLLLFSNTAFVAHIYRPIDLHPEKTLEILKMAFISAQVNNLQDKQGLKFRNGFLNKGAKKLLMPDILKVLREGG
jgi:hypothetical protein